MPEFLPNHLLFRAIPKSQWDPEQGRPFRSAFQDIELSVYWSLLATKVEALEHWVSGNPERAGSGIAEFTVKFAQDQNQVIRHDTDLKPGKPTPHPSHTLVIGKRNKTLQLLFAETVRMCIEVTTSDSPIPNSEVKLL